MSVLPRLSVAVALLLLAAACTGAAPTGSPPPSGSPGPSASPQPSGTTSPLPSPSPSSGSLTVTSYAQAAALVLASNDRFAGIGPQLFDVIGQCCWYEVAEEPDGWQVTVQIGSGDCMAGCIDRHISRYHVDYAGTVTLLSEEGSADRPLPIGSGPASVQIRVVAGPVCPVQQNPPDPDCEPRPVVGAEVIIRAPDGSELARSVSDADGMIMITAEPGTYWLDPQPADGLLGTAYPIAFRLAAGEESGYTLYYDTGIR